MVLATSVTFVDCGAMHCSSPGSEKRNVQGNAIDSYAPTGGLWLRFPTFTHAAFRLESGSTPPLSETLGRFFERSYCVRFADQHGSISWNGRRRQGRRQRVCSGVTDRVRKRFRWSHGCTGLDNKFTLRDESDIRYNPESGKAIARRELGRLVLAERPNRISGR
jgi:hypothetical protein